MDFQITIHSVNNRVFPHNYIPWFIKLWNGVCYLHRTRALTGEDLDFREKAHLARWDKSMRLEVA